MDDTATDDANEVLASLTKRNRKMSTKKSRKKSKRGRPKGSKNKPKDIVIVGKRGRPAKNNSFAASLANINALAKQLEKALISAIQQLKDMG